MTPIYLPENCQSAFQLNWSVAVFGQHDLPPKLTWYEPLKTVTEADGVRILEVHIPQPRTHDHDSKMLSALYKKKLAPQQKKS